MSKKNMKNSGQMHECETAEATSEAQSNSALQSRAMASSPPDLDRRDNKVDPTRKAAGPAQARDGSRGQSNASQATRSQGGAQKPSTPEVTPKEMVSNRVTNKTTNMEMDDQ